MSDDQLRKRVFELECALGKAVKIDEQLRDQNLVLMKANKEMSDCLLVFSGGVQKYLHSMNKQDLIQAVDAAAMMVKNVRVNELKIE